MNLTVSFFISGHLRETKQVTTPCIIGRSSQAGWVLTHPMLSRKHCVLSDKGEELYLSDSGSLNGTRFKGVLVEEPVRLQYGDEFTLGNDLTFLVQPPIESERDTIPLKAAGQTTVVFPDATDSQLSTMATANE